MWDAFISHASEDKESLVRGLSKQLSDVYKVNVWYDEFTLEYGDSLIESIENGLKNCKYGILILSKNFFRKNWTKHEYEGLKIKELISSKKVIVPIWYNITKDEVAKYSLTLSNQVAICINDDFSVDDVAIKLIKIIRPDIYENISRMYYFERLLKSSTKGLISLEDLTKISIPPIRHKPLDFMMESRLKLIYNAIKEVDKRNYRRYEMDFRRSLNIDREMIITELLTAAYIDCTNRRNMSLEEKEEIYCFIFSLGNCTSSLIDKGELDECIKILKKHIKDIDASIVMEYRFD